MIQRSSDEKVVEFCLRADKEAGHPGCPTGPLQAIRDAGRKEERIVRSRAVAIRGIDLSEQIERLLERLEESGFSRKACRTPKLPCEGGKLVLLDLRLRHQKGMASSRIANHAEDGDLRDIFWGDVFSFASSQAPLEALHPLRDWRWKTHRPKRCHEGLH